MNWKKHIVIFLVVFLVVGLLTRGQGCPRAAQRQVGPPEGATIVTITPEPNPAEGSDELASVSYRIEAEVADTAQKRSRGLTERGGLMPGAGILYVYDEPQQPTFNWKQMSFPVSVAFLDVDGTIIDIHKAAPRDPQTYEPPRPVRYVLEVRHGWFEDRGIEPGDRLSVPQVPEAEDAETAGGAADGQTAGG